MFDCRSCYWFDVTDEVCDSCAYGYPTATDNNGNSPDEVTECNIYRELKLQDLPEPRDSLDVMC